MPSLKSRFFLTILRNRHLFRFKFKKETGADWDTTLPEVRRTAEKSAKLMGKPPQGVEITSVAIGDRAADWIRPFDPAFQGAPSNGVEAKGVILYYRGGGYVLGSIKAHRGIVSKFVKGAGVRALLFEYRLAPEHPFPAALDDSVAAYEWLLAQGVPPSEVVFVGDSAGAGLSLAALIALREKGLPLPAGAAVMSPWTDLKCTGESYRTKAGVCVSPPDSWNVCRKHYVGDGDPGSPLISPLYADLKGLPPLLIFAGEDEVLRDDSIRFAEKAAAAGVPVTLTVARGMCHCYPACAPLFPEATEAMKEICGFIRDRIGL